MGKKRPAQPRTRILVDFSSPGWAPIRADVAGLHHRGKRLKELALLGLAAENHGLTCELEGSTLLLRGTHYISGMGSGVVKEPPLRLDVSVAEEILVPSSIVDQFL